MENMASQSHSQESLIQKIEPKQQSNVKVNKGGNVTKVSRK